MWIENSESLPQELNDIRDQLEDAGFVLAMGNSHYGTLVRYTYNSLQRDGKVKGKLIFSDFNENRGGCVQNSVTREQLAELVAELQRVIDTIDDVETKAASYFQEK